MYSIRAIYDGKNFKPTQPVPVQGDYEVVITFLEPVKKDQSGIMKYAGTWDEDDIDLETIMKERENFSLGREEYQ